MSRFVLGPVLACLLALPAGNARAASAPLIPPVDALVERHFEEPAGRFGPGHRGIDYAVPSGTTVRAAGAGTVSFAGPVAGHLAITIDHGSGLETTYSILSRVDVAAGQTVSQGRLLGLTGRAHPEGTDDLHFGVKLAGRYVDPVAYLGSLDVERAIHLAPLAGSLVDELPYELTAADEGAGAAVRACRDPVEVPAFPPPPNDNLAVAVAGLGSSTAGGTNAQLYERSEGPWSLGYPRGRVYRFSYEGTGGRSLHRPYRAEATYRSLWRSATQLEELLVAIGRRHPGAEVDLFAHSQGGLVARLALAHLATSYDPRVPVVEHLVTYGTPHRGAPLAELVE